MPRGLVPCLAIIFVLIGGSSFAATIEAAGISPVTDLVMSKSHSGNFTQGVTGKVYTLLVKNVGGVPTTGAVTVTDILPVGLTATEIAGTGWTCAVGTLTAIRLCPRPFP